MASAAGDIAQFYLPLPVELIREIITSISVWNRDTLVALALVSKTFHNLVMPRLYHTIYLDTEEQALSLIRCIKVAHAHALSADNAKYIIILSFNDTATTHFDDVISLPGLNPQTLLFETLNLPTDNVDQLASSWEARPKCMGVRQDSFIFSSHQLNSWVCQRMALFSHLTHLYLEEELNDKILSFCLGLRTLTHICVPMCSEMDSEDALRQTCLLLGIPSMKLVLIYAAVCNPDDPDPVKTQLNDMDFPKRDLLPLLADSIPDERLYMCPKWDMFELFLDGITPWDSDWIDLTMP